VLIKELQAKDLLNTILAEQRRHNISDNSFTINYIKLWTSYLKAGKVIKRTSAIVSNNDYYN
jgi:hypothetical protein